MTDADAGGGGLPLLTRRGDRLPRSVVWKAAALWVAVAALRAAALRWAPAGVAEHSAALWVLGLLPVGAFALHRGAIGAWSAAAALGVLLSVVELGLAAGPPGAGALTAAGAAVVAAAGASRMVAHFRRQGRSAVRSVFQDPDSGVLSRRGLELVMEKEVGEARRGGTMSVALVAMAGYEEIDEPEIRRHVLREAGEALIHNSRAMDAVGRLEENRFLAILPDADQTGAATFAERVCTKLRSVAVSEGPGSVVDSGVEARAGTATWSEPSAGRAELLREAERALNLALSGEHGRVVTGSRTRLHEVS